MSADLELLWNEALQIVSKDIPKSSLQTWVKCLTIRGAQGTTLFLEAPNDFTLKWVRSKYTHLFRKSFNLLTGADWDFIYVLPGQEVKKETLPAPEEPKSLAPPNTLPTKTGQREQLNPKYTFDTFVVGESSNRFAHAASLAVAEAPGKAYNPLFIYGGVGLGKTHLMHAIGHYVLDITPQMKVVYVTSEQFTNGIVNAIRDDKTSEFRNRYRNVDVLLVDDIQFLAGKERTQEEFFHTFNALYEAGKQIVLSSDRPPREIPTLEDRLRSRFEMGLITDIQAPDLETRIAILGKKASFEGIKIDPDVLTLIAENIHSNIRELEGALIRVVAYSSLTNKPIDMSLAAEALKDILTTVKKTRISIEDIQQTVAKYFSIDVSEMKTKKRSRSVSYPRQVAMYLARELTDSSLPKIGEAFGGRDHTTVLHAYEKISESVQLDAEFDRTIKDIIRNLK